jgi:ATP-dependent DNA helicase RecG
MVSLDDKLQPIVGAKSAKALAGAFEITTVHDLLRHYPRRYAERGQLTDIAGLELGEHVTVMARVQKVEVTHLRNKRNVWLSKVIVTDGSRTLECSFFGPKELVRRLKPGTSALFAGKVSVFRRKLQLTNPDYHLVDEDTEDETVDEFVGILPVYPSAASLQTWQIYKCVRQTLDMLDDI